MNELEMKHAYAIIMAGGSGTRFWPLSRRATPKQLLNLGPEPMPLLTATVQRILPLIAAERILVVTAAHLEEATASALPEIPRENLLLEPAARNTAPCVAWAAATIRRRDPEALITVLPADHHIGDPEAYLALLRAALAAATGGDLVTIGIRPTRPETGYGYIEMGEPIEGSLHRARRFVEKPNRARAEQFLASGRFLWNSGMFFFRADAILEAVELFLPSLGAAIGELDEAAARGQEAETLARLFSELPSVSIDHGVMEKAERVSVLPGSFGWSDLGSWTTAWELAERDAEGNAMPPESLAIESRDCYIVAPEGKTVALVGVEGLVVVDTEDALLIVPRERAQEVKAVVAALSKRGDRSLL